MDWCQSVTQGLGTSAVKKLSIYPSFLLWPSAKFYNLGVFFLMFSSCSFIFVSIFGHFTLFVVNFKWDLFSTYLSNFLLLVYRKVVNTCWNWMPYCFSVDCLIFSKNKIIYSSNFVIFSLIFISLLFFHALFIG